MANHHQGGNRNVALPEENRPSWRPQDQPQHSRGNDDDHDYRSWRDRNDDRGDRDTRRWEGSRGSELGYGPEDRELGGIERYGQGQSGYSAGRYGGDRAQQLYGRNEMIPSGYEDRNRDYGVDDRFSGRGRGDDPERHGGGRGFESRSGSRSVGGGYEDRGGYPSGQNMGYPGGQNMGYPGGQNMGYPGGQNVGYSGGSRAYQGGQHMGYSGGPGGYQGSSYGRDVRGWQDETRRSSGEARSPGAHRGKGPVGYQRSDERLREMICEALSDDDQIDASQIEVSVKSGEVTLSGSVDDRGAKRDAEECAVQVSGVRDVQNLLRVKGDKQQSGRSHPSGKSETEATSSDKKYRA